MYKMARFKVTLENIRVLEIKADEAYEMLKRGVETPEPLLIHSAELLYRDLESYVNEIISPTRQFRSFRKGGKRARKIEKFILQCVLMNHVSPEVSSGYEMAIAEYPEDNMGGLQVYLDAKDEEKPEVFRQLQDRALEARNKKQHLFILNALDYVRD